MFMYVRMYVALIWQTSIRAGAYAPNKEWNLKEQAYM